MTRTWPADWDEQMAGAGCAMCKNVHLEDNGFGVCVLAGNYTNVFLQRSGPLPGYAISMWNGPHVAEPHDLAPEAAAGYWLETLAAARAIRAVFLPAKINYQTLGNSLPHLHTHILARYVDDAAPGRPLPFGVDDTEVPQAAFEEQVRQLRALLSSAS
jgi:diadenosine tetraphosphate (Ap4A) HIT family hydrolase